MKKYDKSDHKVRHDLWKSDMLNTCIKALVEFLCSAVRSFVVGDFFAIKLSHFRESNVLLSQITQESRSVVSTLSASNKTPGLSRSN